MFLKNFRGKQYPKQRGSRECTPSETSVNLYHTTWRRLPEFSTLHCHDGEKFSLTIFNTYQSRLTKSMILIFLLILLIFLLILLRQIARLLVSQLYQPIHYYPEVSLRLDVKVSECVRSLIGILFSNIDGLS
jgi:ABC-type polysaccharide transport system permease subunit